MQIYFSKFESNLKPKVKGRVHTDEVYEKVKGKGHYSINSVDSKTKFNLATTFTKHRTKQKCKAHFKKLKNKIGDQVKDICKKHGLNYNNNAIERHNEDFKQRSNVMRGG